MHWFQTNAKIVARIFLSNFAARKSMATEQEKIFADAILSAIGSSFKGPDSLTGIFATSGSQYNGDLMVVGRAANGWTPEFRGGRS